MEQLLALLKRMDECGRGVPGSEDKALQMDLDIWSFYTHKHGDSRARIVPDLCSMGRDGSSFACETHYNRPFIDADGRLVPCMPGRGTGSRQRS